MINLLWGKGLRRNATITFVRQIVAALAQLLTIVIIARSLGPEGNGLYTMTILVPTLMSTFLNLGVAPATVYFIGKGDTSAQQAIIQNLKLAYWVSLIGLFVALPSIYLWGEKLFPNVPMKLLLLGLLAFPLSLLVAYWSSVLQALEDFKAFNWTILVPPLVTLVLTSVAILIIGVGVIGAMVSYIVGQAIGVIVVWRFIRKFKGASVPVKLFVGYKRRLVNYGWKAHLSNVLSFVNYRADIFLVNFFLNPAATGIYVIAVQMAEKLWLLSQAASTVLLPRLSSMHKEPEKRYKLTLIAALSVGAVTAIGALLLTFVLYFLLSPIFGDKYFAAFVPFLWLLPGIVAGSVARVKSNGIAAAGKPEWNFYAAILVVALNIVGNVMLIPEYGMKGAAIATSIAYVTNALIKLALLPLTKKF